MTFLKNQGMLWHCLELEPLENFEMLFLSINQLLLLNHMMCNVWDFSLSKKKRGNQEEEEIMRIWIQDILTCEVSILITRLKSTRLSQVLECRFIIFWISFMVGSFFLNKIEKTWFVNNEEKIFFFQMIQSKRTPWLKLFFKNFFLVRLGSAPPQSNKVRALPHSRRQLILCYWE